MVATPLDALLDALDIMSAAPSPQPPHPPLRTETHPEPKEPKEPKTREEMAQLLARTSHDLRTPLNGIIGGLELLKETTLNPEQTHYSHLIRVCTLELLTITERLATLANVLMQNPPAPSDPPIALDASLHTLNPEQLQELRDESLLEHLTDLFRDTFSATYQEMRHALEQCDTALLSTKAHLIKGSAANFGAERLVAVCQAMETQAGERAPDALRRLLEQIHDEYQRVEKGLREISSSS